MKPFIVLVLLLVFWLPRAASALQFRTLGWDAPVSGLYYSAAGREVALTAAPTALSPAFTLDHGDVLKLYRLDADRTRRPAGSLPVPQGLARAILVLHVAADGSCSGRWLDDSPEATPAGALRVYNLASKPVALGVGNGAVHTLAPGADTLARFPLDARAIPVRLAAQVGDHWEAAMSISQPVRPRLRFIVLVRDGRPTLDNPHPLLDWMPFHELLPPAGNGGKESRG